MSAVPETLNLSLLARQYVANGWALVPIPPGTKGPTRKGWNRIENCVTTVAGCARIRDNVGLAHAFSRTCVLDFDDLKKSAEWLAEHGIDFGALWNNPLAVRISSGVANRGKLLFKLPDGIAPLRTHKIPEALLELRCASATGSTMQDVLPPSIHPITRAPYEWDYAEPVLGDWRTPPELPADMLAVWQALSAREGNHLSEPGNGDIGETKSILAQLDPDSSYMTWFEIGAAIHHEFNGGYEGLELWDEWSAGGGKYRGIDDLEYHWRTMNADREGAKSTLESLRAMIRRRPASIDDFLSWESQADAAEEKQAEPAGSSSIDDFEDISEECDPPVSRDLSAMPAPKPEKAKGFVFQSVDEFLSRTPPDWIIKGVLPRAVLAVIYGESGSGKSFIALDQAMAIARGEDWRGKRTKQGTVAYVVAEGASGFTDRVKAYCHRHNVDKSGLPLRILAAAPNLMDAKKDAEGGVYALARALRKLGPVSVVYIDTYARVLGEGNENEAKDTNAIVANCAFISEVTGALVVLIHHSGKDSSKGARGSGALRAAADAEFAVGKSEARHTVTVTKMKDGEDGGKFHYKLAPVVVGLDDDGEDRTSCVVEHIDSVVATSDDAGQQKKRGEVQTRILERLAEYPDGIAENDLLLDIKAHTPANAAGVKDHNWKVKITKPLAKMVSAGEVVEIQGVYSLPKTACE
jgi:hypothetical protein